MQSHLVSHRNAIKYLYAPESLARIIEAADSFENSDHGNIEFSNFQRDILQEKFPGFHYEFCVTSLIETTQAGVPVDLSSICLNLPTAILQDYVENAHLDNLSPLVYLNPGRALNYTTVCPDHKVEEHPFFKAHCLKYGIYRGVSLGFLFPAHHNTYLTFDYLGDKKNKSWMQFDHSRLELATFPFALALLYRRKQMDQVEIKRRFSVMAGLTEHQLQNLRKFINAPDQNFEQQAFDLGIKQGTLKDDLYHTRKIVFGPAEKGEGKPDKKTRLSLRALEAQCQFMRMLGDHTKPLRRMPKS